VVTDPLAKLAPWGQVLPLGRPTGGRFEMIYIHETPGTPQEINPGGVRSSDVQNL
jgi:hypothetical protein